MKKIVITGASGFIGSELIEKLKDFEVHSIERYVTGRYAVKGMDSLGDIQIIKHYASLTDYPAIRNIIHEVKPEYVIHLAAISAVSFSYDHFIEVGEVNYLGTINLAEACYREVPYFKQFIFAGTSEEYGMTLDNPDNALNEDSKLMPNSPYAVAKAAGDYYLKYMGLAYNFPYTILRAFNTYGRKSNRHFFIERIITQMLENGNSDVYLGEPTAVRDWLYVEDQVNGYAKALGNERAIGQTIQLCTGKEYTTKETADLIAGKTGFSGKIHWNSIPQRPLDAKVLIGDNSRAKEILGWEPRTNLNDGLDRTIAYYKSIKK